MATVISKKLSLLFLLFAAVFCGSGQPADASTEYDIDSLFVVFSNAEGMEFLRNANIIVEALGDTANFTNNVPANAIRARVLKSVIFYYYDMQRFRDVEKLAFQSIEIYEDAADSVNLAGCYHTLGIAYHHLGVFDKAIEYYYKSTDILDAIGGDGSQRRIRYTLNNIGAIYLNIEDYDMAEKLFEQCIAMLNDRESKERNMLDLSNYLNNLAEIYCKQAENLEGKESDAKIKQAITNAERAYALSSQYDDEPVKLATRLVTLAVAYTANRDYSAAEQSLTKAQAIAEEHDLTHVQVEILATNATLKHKTGNFSQSFNLYDQAIALAEQHEYNELLKHVAQGAYVMNREIAPASALRYYEIYVAVKEAILNEESQTQINDFQVKYRTQEKELEIVRQKAEISHHQTLRLVYIGGLIAAGLLLALLIHTVRLRTKRNRELAEMNATKDRFFAIISHDLKNPTIAQRDALQMLIDFSDHWNTETLTKFYYELLKSADSQIELLYNLLNWAQVQTGRMPYQPLSFDITTALRSDIVLIKNMAERKNITFDIQMPETAIITGDSNMLVTVIRNLLTNAIKFTAANGTVTLNITPSPSPIRTGDPCSRPPSSPSYTISITDTGTGMSPEQIQNLFRIDKQHSRKGTSGESGSGLGLMVCKELIEKHSSTLHIESEEGKGSRFQFEI
ncbi:MAG: tetratricopeptide repeat-containing sensor histidine kinase [Bacteroidales bacterium]|nr:tetratricopeptide repeat-containing sensor histidine kinase [Bacteroidales bacterium]